MAKNDQYFPHDYQARNDVKCLFLRQQLGMEGYGIFWFLIESLADAGGILPMKIIPVLSMQMQLPEIKVQAVISNFDLFELNENGFFSLRLNKHLELRSMLSIKGKEGARKRWIDSPPIAPPISGAYAKERKGKEIKGKVFTPPLLNEVEAYFQEKGYTNESAVRAWNYYNELNWIDSKGNQVRNWKGKMVSTWMKDENKITIPVKKMVW